MTRTLVLSLLILTLTTMAVEARRLPTQPIEIFDQDRESILKILDVEPERVLDVKGWADTTVSPRRLVPQATLTLFEKRLNERLVLVSERYCVQSASDWQCPLEHPYNRDLYRASLPRPCANAPGAHPNFLKIMVDTKLLPEKIDRLLNLICTSELIRQEITSQGHTFTMITKEPRREFQGNNTAEILRIHTYAPNTLDAGGIIRVEEVCSETECEFVVRQIHGWMT